MRQSEGLSNHFPIFVWIPSSTWNHLVMFYQATQDPCVVLGLHLMVQKENMPWNQWGRQFRASLTLWFFSPFTEPRILWSMGWWSLSTDIQWSGGGVKKKKRPVRSVDRTTQRSTAWPFAVRLSPSRSNSSLFKASGFAMWLVSGIFGHHCLRICKRCFSSQLWVRLHSH